MLPVAACSTTAKPRHMLRSKTDVLAARLLLLCFFPRMELQIAALLIAVAYFTTTTIIDKYKAPAINYVMALCLSAGFYLYLAAFIFTPAPLRSSLGELCSNRLSYLLLPFFFATISPTQSQFIRSQLLWFVYGCLALCTIANARFLYNFIIVPHTVQHLGHEQYRIYIEFITGIHPTYISMYLCFSTAILLMAPGFSGRRAWFRYGIIYLLLVFLLSMLAKSALLAVIIILVHYAYTQRRSLAKYSVHIAGGIAALAAALYFIPFFWQRMAEVLQFTGITRNTTNTTDNSMHIRKLIWDSDVHLLHQHWLTGVGPAALRHVLTIRYFFYSVANGFFVGYYDPHNQYMFDWLSFGVLGIAVLLFTLGLQVIKAWRTKDRLYLYLLIILCVTFSTETVLSRQYGVVFYAVLTSLFFFTQRGKPDKIG